MELLRELGIIAWENREFLVLWGIFTMIAAGACRN